MFFTIKLYLHLNCVLMLNWIVWNRATFTKMDLVLNNLQRLIYHKTQPTIYTQLNGFRYCHLILTIQLNNHLLTLIFFVLCLWEYYFQFYIRYISNLGMLESFSLVQFFLLFFSPGWSIWPRQNDCKMKEKGKTTTVVTNWKEYAPGLLKKKVKSLIFDKKKQCEDNLDKLFIICRKWKRYNV